MSSDWRKGWDSNPRYSKTVNRISNPAHSTTLPPFRMSFQLKAVVILTLAVRSAEIFRLDKASKLGETSREPLIKSTMSRVAEKMPMNTRRKPQVVAAHGPVTGAASRLREVRHSHLSRTCASRYRVEMAVLRSLRFATSGLQQSAYCLRLLARGITMRCVTFLVPHPVQPHARPCGT